MTLKRLFGKRLKQLRESRGLTQQELAELCDMQTNSIGLIEIGKRAASFSTIEILAEKLDVHYYELFSFSFGNDPGKEELIEELTTEVSVFDKTLLKHMISYAKSMAELFRKKKIR